jgi:hypothetical protein
VTEAPHQYQSTDVSEQVGSVRASAVRFGGFESGDSGVRRVLGSIGDDEEDASSAISLGGCEGGDSGVRRASGSIGGDEENASTAASLGAAFDGGVRGGRGGEISRDALTDNDERGALVGETAGDVEMLLDGGSVGEDDVFFECDKASRAVDSNSDVDVFYDAFADAHVERWIATAAAFGDDVFDYDDGVDDVTRDIHRTALRENSDTGWLPVAVCHADGSGQPAAVVRPMRLTRLTKRERIGGFELRPMTTDRSALCFAEMPQVAAPPTTEAPPPFAVPSVDLQRRVRAGRLCFDNIFDSSATEGWRKTARRSNDDFWHRGDPAGQHRVRARFSKKSGEFRVGTREHHPLVVECFRLSIVLRLDNDGFYQTVDPREVTIEHGFDGDKLAKAAAAIGVKDEEILTAMGSNGARGGYRDHSDSMPCVSSFSTNQRRALERFDGPNGLEATLDKEVDDGFYGPPDSAWTDAPPFAPPSVIPLNQADKSNGSSRLIGNRSAPVGHHACVLPGGSFHDTDGQPLSSNDNTDRSCLRMGIWLQIEHISLAVAVLTTAALSSGLPLRGRVFDLDRWFRKLATAVVEWRKVIFFVKGRYLGDKRDAMGGVSAADHGQRTTSVAIEVVRATLLPEVAGVVDSTPGPRWDRLRAWVRARRDVGCADPYPWFLSSFQDDITSLCISEEIGVLLDTRIPEVLAEYQIEVSTKPEASRPSSGLFTAIGADYDMLRAHIDGTANVQPRRAIADKFVAAADAIVTAGGAFSESLETFSGLAEFVGRFSDVGCGPIHRARAAASRHRGFVRIGSGAFFDNITALRQPVAHAARAPMVIDPCFMAPALHGCHGDASTTDGYGATVNGVYCCGAWPAPIAQLIAADMLFISPLELMVSALVVLVAAEAAAPARLVIYSDSESSVVVGARRRARKATMDVALWAFKEAQRVSDRRAWLAHIDGLDNTVADALSHAERPGRLKLAESTLRAHGFKPRQIRTPAIFFEWLQRLGSVARRTSREKPALEHPAS